jgi:hypothetical protein
MNNILYSFGISFIEQTDKQFFFHTYTSRYNITSHKRNTRNKNKKGGRMIPTAKSRVRYSMPKNFFCSSHKMGKGYLHFSTPI